MASSPPAPEPLVIQETLSFIEETRLPHPSGPLLSEFIREALNPATAARFVAQRCRDAADERAGLQSLVSDWTYIVESYSTSGQTPPTPDADALQAVSKRDGERCCITGWRGSWSDPLIVVPNTPVPVGWISDHRPEIFQMLGAFFGTVYRDWWLSYTREPNVTNPFHSHWLVRKSAALAFTQGRVRLDRLHPSFVEFEASPVPLGPGHSIQLNGLFPLLGDHSRSGLAKVDPRFIGTQARFSRSIRLVKLAKQLAASERGPRGSSVESSAKMTTPLRRSTMSTTVCSIYFSIWRLLPARIRISAYEALRHLGYRLYGGPGDYATVQRLPFGLYLKYQGQPDGYRNEYNALRLVQKYTSVPAPRPLDFVVRQASNPEDPLSEPEAYLLISRLPGDRLHLCEKVMSDSGCDEVASQLQRYITQLRAIPKQMNPDAAICNTLGEAIIDSRIRNGDPVGPFKDEASFSQMLRYADNPSRRGHNIVFTHADLNARNILASQDKDGSWCVTGIVDWEFAGYYPEYWDYTKAFFEGFRWNVRYNDMLHKTFKVLGDYSEELETEQTSWGEGDGI